MDDGWGWIFTAVEHWNAECVGWKIALQPISMGLAGLYGSSRWITAPSICRQPMFWGIQPSYAFVTNGVAGLRPQHRGAAEAARFVAGMPVGLKLVRLRIHALPCGSGLWRRL